MPSRPGPDYGIVGREEREVDRLEASERAERKIAHLERQLAQSRATVNALQGTLRTVSRLARPYSGDR